MKPEVETSLGRISGLEQSGVRVFRGVRFAQPPIGRQRFLPPIPPEPWTGTVDATQHGPAAPQAAVPWLRWLNAAGLRIGEDCLSLNVWTPGLDDARRPVMVWIHGGGFLIGSGATAVYNGRTLAQRGDLVVVTLNYRLGALGYTHLGQLFGEGFEQSSNLGVRDQIAALEWVRDNIDRFGGNSDNVTLFGQSAGAMSIGALLGAPRARKLFHRAICQSGATGHVLDPDEARHVAKVFLRELGGPQASHELLGKIPLARIMKAQGATTRQLSNRKELMVFRPVVDGDLIPEQPIEAVRRGATAGIPLLVGVTLDEWKLFRIIDQGPRALREEDLLQFFEEVLPGEFADAPGAGAAMERFRTVVDRRTQGTNATDLWSAFQSARVFHLPAWRLAEAQLEGSGEAYAYLFTWRTPALRNALGACHALDLPFVFGSTRNAFARPLTGLSASADRLSLKMQHSWIRFARDGRPGHERLPDWKPYDSRHRSAMILGRKCSFEKAPLESERRLLESWAPSASEAPAGQAATRKRRAAGPTA